MANNNKTNIPAGLTPEMVEQLVSSPGTVVSNSPGTQAEVIQAQRSVDISKAASKQIRPNISGNQHDATGERISRPSPKLADRLSAGHEERMKELADEKQRREELAASTPEALNKQVQYLTRAVKKLQSELKLLKSTDNA